MILWRNKNEMEVRELEAIKDLSSSHRGKVDEQYLGAMKNSERASGKLQELSRGHENQFWTILFSCNLAYDIYLVQLCIN